jgi:hypothetical protein
MDEVVPDRIAREQAAEEAKARALEALTALAADLLRMIAGAGKGHSIVQRAGEFVAAVEDHHKAAGMGLGVDDIRRHLTAALPDQPEAETRRYALDVRNDDRDVTIACLRIVASRMLGQLTQENSARGLLATALHARDDRLRRRK